MLWIGYIIISLLAVGFALLWADAIKKEKNSVQQITELEAAWKGQQQAAAHWMGIAKQQQELYEQELENNKTILSQKKSSETRLGQMTEHIVPFLDAFPYDPKNSHFLGQPIDFVVFDYDDGKIVFVEVKTGNAKESPRQKLIKNIIKSGRVYYESLRVNPKGVRTKKAENND